MVIYSSRINENIENSIKSNKTFKQSAKVVDDENPANADVARDVKESNTGMIAGVVVGAAVVIIIVIVIVILMTRKKRDPDEDSCNDAEDFETEFEASSSMTESTDINTSYITQEMSKTMWYIGETADHAFFKDEIDEVEITYCI